jgi:hypothetical protein
MTSNRQFLIEDIVAMSHRQSDMLEVLKPMTDEGLYALWRDLVNQAAEEHARVCTDCLYP